MVFCGKPSKGCTHCRTRRIKCDQVSPACSQCLRAGKQCPGYRDQLSLMFRDENEKVVTKARISKPKPEQRKRSPVSSSSSSSPEPASPPGSVQEQAIISRLMVRSPSLSARDEGITFFFNHYATEIPEPRGEPDIMGSTVYPLLCRSESFTNAVSSVGYAGLSNVTKNPNHMIIARRKYAASLQSITRALGDLANSDLDATLKSVLLLAAYEIVNGSSPCIGVGPSWAVHIDGGAAILKMMDKEKLAPPRRRRGWIQLVFAVYIKSLSRGEAAPAAMQEWCESCRLSLKPADVPAITLANMAYRFTNLHASIRNNTLLDSNAILLEALALDSELEEWQKSLPEVWKYELIPASDAMPFTFFGKTHEYQHVWVSRVLNNYRWLRILVNELLLIHMRQLGTSVPEHENQREKSIEIITAMATDICTGISSSFFRPRVSGTMSGVFMVLFPLGIAGSAWVVSDELHSWVLNLLKYIGNKMGISQAISMVDLVQKQRTAFGEMHRTSRTVADLWAPSVV